MRILLLCDDFYHPGQIPADGLKPMEAKGFNIDVISDATGFNPEILANYNGVVLCKCDHISQKNKAPWKTPAVQAAFVKYVETGGGLLVVHNGTVPGENENGNFTTEIIDNLVGCRFVFHPNNCRVTTAILKPHPITEGVEIFHEIDEHYKVKILDSNADILAASYSDAQGDAGKYDTEPYFNSPPCIAPAAYVRTQGKGRVCVLTPGHTLEVWFNPQFQKLLENALRWCTTSA
ncbi:MAG: ThuA domain-containing protein [Defluviitaleaceae bacterium]|nr:ThuA domain-containing protein [Defluviitaleaceae bacterium]